MTEDVNQQTDILDARVAPVTKYSLIKTMKKIDNENNMVLNLGLVRNAITSMLTLMFNDKSVRQIF